MNCLKIFLRAVLLVSLFPWAGCVSGNTGADVETEDNNPGTVVPEQDRAVSENTGSEIDLYDIPHMGEIQGAGALVSAEPVDSDVIFEAVVWAAPERTELLSEMPLPEVQLREKKEETVIIPPLFHFYDMGLREGEESMDYAYSSDSDSFTKSEILQETVLERDLLPAASMHNEKVHEEISTKIIIKESRMNAFVMSKLDITLSGRGWIYLFEKEASFVEYVGKHFIADSTVYTFLPELPGKVVLRFQFQDLVNNIHTIEKINLSVLPAESDISRENVSASIVPESVEKSDPLSLEESLLILLDTNDSLGLSEIVPVLVKSTLPSIRKQFPVIAEVLFDSSYFVQSAIILEEFLKSESIYIAGDRIFFLLGEIYEQDSHIRNEIISATYYKKLIDGYPASIYWDESRDRYRFLKRRYIDIR